jgi:methyl-accepting chemotaxis protein
MHCVSVRWVIVIGLVVVIGVGAYLIFGTGESKADKAMDDVCDARAGISQQVDTLRGLTPANASVDKVKTSVQAILDDLSKIAQARKDLADANREQVQQANQEFAAKVKDLAGTVARSVTAQDAKAQLAQAAQDLAGVYRTTYGKIDCS